MKKILLLLFILFSYAATAQNYQCLQSGVKPFYTNGNGYLRGIKIDSVTISDSDTIYYPYHTPRGRYVSPLDSNGGSWLGKQVIKEANGTFLFDDIWYDTVVIKTQAHLGDTWTFFEDTTNVSYKATVTGVDTMTILGTIDSVKIITLEADISGVINPSDPVNNFEIILSGNHGFVQVFDLYTFPYHLPGNVSIGMQGYDYYFDLISGNLLCFCDGAAPFNSATVTNSIFHLIPFHNPTLMEVYNFSPGGVFEFYEYQDLDAGDAEISTITLDTILSKTTTSSSVSYTTAQIAIETTTTSGGVGMPPVVTTDQYDGIAANSYDTTLLIDTTIMPEEWNANYFYHFFPKAIYDSAQLCPDTVCIVDVNNISYPSGQVIFEQLIGGLGMSFIANNTTAYGIGFGVSAISYTNYTANNSGYGSYNFVDNNGNICGNYLSLSTPQVNAIVTHIEISPNPATDLLTIQSTNQPINQITITNLLGQTVYTQSCNNVTIRIDVSGLPADIYLIQCQSKDGTVLVNKFIKN